MSLLRGLLRATKRTVAAAEAALGPWLDLAVRLWTAQAFLIVALHDMMAADRRLSAPLTAEWWAGLVHQVTTSMLGLTAQSLCPLLLAWGLASRPAAAAMLLQLLLEPDDFLAARPLWAALLLGVLVLGPGPLSIDWLLRGGSESIALPGAAAIRRSYDALRRAGGPYYDLGLRLWLAGAMANIALKALSLGPTLPLGLAEWLPGSTPMMPAVSAPVGLGLAALVALGLLTRPVSLILLGLIPFTRIEPGDGGLSWALLLAGLALRGSGPYGLDRWLARELSRMTPAADRPDLPHVVVVGGGFGGVAAARGLHDADCRVTLVDRRNHHLFQPLLYQVATASLSPGDIATPIREMFRAQANCRVLLKEVIGIDARAKRVLLDRGEVAYDFLVVATGARHSYLGHADWEEVAPGLKSAEDGTAIRRRLLLAFEEAEAAISMSERRAWLTFVVVGGGPTGVELAGALAELARFGLADDFRQIDPASARVVLAHSGPRLLPTFPARLSQEAERTLKDLGVEVRLESRVEAVTPHSVTISGQAVLARTVLWAAGVMASPAAAWLGLEADRAGRVTVGPDLTAAGLPEVFVVGDTAAARAWKGRDVPGLAPAARQGGAYAAQVISARLAGRPGPGPFRYRHLGSLATIGRKSAVADFGCIKLHGALAWWLWGAAHIAFLIGGRNRVIVLVQWLWSYLTYRRGTRLITDGPGLASRSAEGRGPIAGPREPEEGADRLARAAPR